MEVANNNSVLVGYPPYLDEKRCAGKGSEIDSLAEFFGIDDLLDFPNEEIIAAPIHPGSSDIGLSFSLSSVKSDMNLMAPPSLPPLWDENHPSELCVTCDDVAELEWLSHFVDESFSSADNGLLQYSKEEDGNKSHMSPSSTSLPENKGSNSNNFASSDGGDSNSNENGKHSLAMMVPGRPRSKRARKGIAGAGWNSSRMLLPSTPLDDSSFSPSPSPSSSSSSSSSPNSNSVIAFLDCSDTPFIIHPHFQYINPFADSCNQPQLASLEEEGDQQAAIVKKLKPKSTKPKMKLKPMLVMNCGAIPSPVQQPVVVDQSLLLRKCLHCGSQKTPQWRAGPLGPKTLCNACGVRHKSGRLFPEYRPAASPTFMESRHSNSHRKVLEMRRFKESTTTHNSIFT